MYSFKRIMVGLDFSALDQTLIRYTEYLSKQVSPEKIYFINIQPDFDLPEEISQQMPGPEKPLDEQCREAMQKAVEANFKDHQRYEITYKVVEGSPRREILRWVHIKQAELLIVGRKDLTEGSGITPRQLARKLPCSILILPEKDKFEMRRLVVSSDFSPFSMTALQTALGLTEDENQREIIHLNVYTVPPGYYRTGKTEAEFAQIMEKHAMERYEQFVSGLSESEKALIKPVFLLRPNRQSAGEAIGQWINENPADLLLVGARGRNVATGLLLGSVAEKVISTERTTPVLLAKDPERTFSFLDLIENV